MKNRQRQRVNRRLRHHEEKLARQRAHEEMLDTHNAYGVYDPTPYAAVLRLRAREQAQINR